MRRATGSSHVLPYRNSVRLKDYDYSQAGAYFITICTYDRRHLFGEVIADAVHLNSIGEIVREEWAKSAEIRREIDLDVFVVMPNHLHGIVVLLDGERRRASIAGRPHGPSPRSVASLVGGFKAAATKRINALHPPPQLIVWQRNYYEHVIRDEDDLSVIREYVANNPAKWNLDRYYSSCPAE